MSAEQDAIYELSYYTLSHTDPAFIHQHIVDAFAAQTSTPEDKPIKLTFALVGLYLQIEKRYTGKQVQQAHMKLAARKQAWPTFFLPEERGAMTVREVLAAPPGPERDRKIHQWCEVVWAAFEGARPTIEALLREHGMLE